MWRIRARAWEATYPSIYERVSKKELMALKVSADMSWIATREDWTAAKRWNRWRKEKVRSHQRESRRRSRRCMSNPADEDELAAAVRGMDEAIQERNRISGMWTEMILTEWQLRCDWDQREAQWVERVDRLAAAYDQLALSKEIPESKESKQDEQTSVAVNNPDRVNRLERRVEELETILLEKNRIIATLQDDIATLELELRMRDSTA